MREIMVDSLPERERGEGSERIASHISSGIDEYSDEIERYSLSPTPSAFLRFEEALASSDYEVELTKALGEEIEITDENLKGIDIDTEEGEAQALALTAAMAKKAKKEVRDSRLRQKVDDFTDNLLEETSRFLASNLGKKALTVIPAGALIASACSPALTSTKVEEGEVQEPVATEITTPPEATETQEPTETPTEVPSPELEDGTKMERVEQGEFVELFPGSEVYKSERGDVVIINKETGLELAGQKLETKYGSFTLLIGKSYYQFLYREHMGESINFGGYPNFAGSELKSEITRITSTLLELQEGEISVGSVDLATHEPQKKDLVAIYTNPGTVRQLSESMPQGLVKPEEMETIVHRPTQLGFPTLKASNGEKIFIRMIGASGYKTDWADRFRSVGFEDNLYDSLDLLYLQLVYEAAQKQGIGIGGIKYMGEGWGSIENSLFAPLFSDPGIRDGMIAFTKWSPIRGPYTPEQLDEVADMSDYGSPGLVEVDFGLFK